MIVAKNNDMYAIKATILANKPLSLYRLNEIKVTATTKKIIPAKEIHIFVMPLISSMISPLIQNEPMSLVC